MAIPESIISPLVKLFSQGKTKIYSRHETLPTNTMYFQVISGYAALCEDTPNERGKLIFLFGKHDIIPYPNQSFSRPIGATYRHIALDMLEVKAVPRNQFMHAIKEDPELGNAFDRYLMYLLDLSFARIADLGDLAVEERLKKRLLFCADRFGIQEGNHIVIEMPFTHYEMAAAIGATRETVNRTINKWKKEKQIELIGRKIIIYPSTFWP